MIYPIFAYGSPVLRKIAQPIDKNYDGFNELISDMFETMYKADGMGLAAPQIGKSIRLFVIDARVLGEEDESLQDFKKVFINAQMYDEQGDEWSFNEGCLSLPAIREDVKRKTSFRLKYQDENFVEHDELFDGLKARIIQHEYDHLQGIVFTDRVGILRKRLLKSKLMSISKGKVDVKYKMSFPLLKK
jgi:peptide deformylase